MLPLLIPAVIGLTGAVAYKAHKKKTTPTPQQKMILDTALNQKRSREDYLKLADSFDAEGLKIEAAILRNRAALGDLTVEQKAVYRSTFRKALTLEDPAKVLKIADAFAKQGATGAASDLKKYAQGLKDGTAAPTPLGIVPPAGNGGPSIISTPPTVIATPSPTATPTVVQSTGAAVAAGSNIDPSAQGAPPAAPVVVVAPPIGAPSTAAVVASIAVAAPLAAVPTSVAVQTATPTVTASTGSATSPATDLTTPMGQ